MKTLRKKLVNLVDNYKKDISMSEQRQYFESEAQYSAHITKYDLLQTIVNDLEYILKNK